MTEGTGEDFGMTDEDMICLDEEPSGLSNAFCGLLLGLPGRGEKLSRLLDFLRDRGFFELPCGEDSFLTSAGGLARHSMNVYRYAHRFARALMTPGQYSEYRDSVTFCALLHDIGQIGRFLPDGTLYGPEMLTAGEISVTYLNSFSVPVSFEEADAVRFHEGLYQKQNSALRNRTAPLILVISFADLWCKRVAEAPGYMYDREERHRIRTGFPGASDPRKTVTGSLERLHRGRGMTYLLKKMEDCGFFTAPCSGRFHLCREGGLAEHSCNVLVFSLRIAQSVMDRAEYGTNRDSVIFCALLHDLGKMGRTGRPYYVPNVLKSGKVSGSVPYRCNRQELCDHALISCEIIEESRVTASFDEKNAIRFHDGLYLAENDAIRHNETPLYIILSSADLWCSRIYEAPDSADDV